MMRHMPAKISVITISLGAIAFSATPISAKFDQAQFFDVTEMEHLQYSSDLIGRSAVQGHAQTENTKSFLLAQNSSIKKKRVTTRKLSSPQIKARWRHDTWRSGIVQNKLKNPNSTAEIPDTDCPPLPAQTCLDSWKDANDDIANWPD